MASFYATPINALDRTDQKNEEKLSRELIQALHRNERNLWEPILKKQMRQNSQSKTVESAVYTAVYLEYIEFLESFRKLGGDIRQTLIPTVANPERHIITEKKEKVFEYLLNRNLLVLTSNSPIEKIELNTDIESSVYVRKMMEASYKSDLLYQAVMHGTDRMVELLLEKGFNPNQLDASGSHTALLIAMRDKDSFNKTKLLLEHNADPNKMADRKSIFRDIDYQFKNDRRTLDQLIQYGLELDDPDMELVRSGVQMGSVDFLEYLKNNSVPLDPKPLKRRVSPLYLALTSGNNSEEVIKFLIKNGYDPKEVYQDGNTPLHLAIEYSSSRVVQLLLEKGLKKSIPNKGGYTPIDYAQTKLEIITLLKGFR